MGLHDRPYWRDDQGSPPQPGGMMGSFTLGLPKPGKVIKMLLIVNFVVFLLQTVLDQPRVVSGHTRPGLMSTWLGAKVEAWWQVWRYVTAQFLHGGFWHIVMNMLGLYMLGTPLEGRWGSKRFLTFYLSCGVTACVAYVLIGALVGTVAWMPIVGASGGVYGVVLACAVLFPHFRIIFLFFPVPIRLAALVIFGGMVFLILESVGAGQFGSQFWSDVAHLGGAVCAAVWIWAVPRLRSAAATARFRAHEGAWQRKLQRQAQEEAEVDRILDKVHDQGLQSLTKKERKTLQNATRRSRDEDRLQ